MKEVKILTLREKFDSKGFGVTKYARAHKLSQPILSNILNGKGETTGTNKSRLGKTRLIYRQLKKDGIWIGALPWEVKR